MEHARHHAVEHHGWIRGRGDFVIALLLGVTVIAIAWGAYRAELGAKDADHSFNRSVETLGTAHKLELQGDQEVATDEGLFVELERDRLQGTTKAAALHRRLLPADALRAIDWWQRQPASTRPPSPFVDANPQYRNVYYARGTALERQAKRYVEAAHEAENRMIDYTIVSAILTVALFVLGIAAQFTARRVKVALVLVGAIVLLGSLVRFVDLAS